MHPLPIYKLKRAHNTDGEMISLKKSERYFTILRDLVRVHTQLYYNDMYTFMRLEHTRKRTVSSPPPVKAK